MSITGRNLKLGNWLSCYCESDFGAYLHVEGTFVKLRDGVVGVKVRHLLVNLAIIDNKEL